MTVIVFIERFGPLFSGGFGKINDTSNPTFVLPEIKDDRETETSAASPSNTAGNKTAPRVSTALPLASKVEITRSFFDATAYGGRTRPVMEQTTAELEEANKVLLIAILKNGLLYTAVESTSMPS